MKPIAFIAGAGLAYIIYKAIGEKESSNNTTKIPESQLGGPGSKVATSNNMIVEVQLTVSGFEKLRASPSYIRERVTPAVLEAGRLVCAHAPVLQGTNPKIEPISNSRGYLVRISWPARWSSNRSGLVRQSVSECLKAGFLASSAGKKVANRITSFKVFRV